ncbi:hypothetical protein [Butyrivibrio sp. ob235]|uniref:hypothetical protein n=1 Tax=Butyrivibrio sp. ob235 TaxID=1761780 RepID=UPI000B8379FA|nr:hypothetical protein [Butyrivibrio sp. ob235]
MNKVMCRKILILSLATVILFAFSGCGKKSDVSKLDKSSVQVNKDGSVVSTMIEDFSESYYSVDELREMTENEVNAFVVKNGEGTAELKSVDTESGKIKMVMSFGNSDNFSDFNSEKFIYETVADAKLNGHIETGLLVDADGNPIESDKASDLSDEHIVVTAMKNIVAAPYKIKYVSRGVKIIDNYLADLSEIADDSMACIVLSK